MTNSSSEQSPSRPLGRRIVLALLVILLILATAGFLYENIAEARDRRFNAMGGKLVDLGGRKMHLNCSGESSPTVILDSGLGENPLSWQKVETEIAKFPLVCSVDRGGLV